MKYFLLVLFFALLWLQTFQQNIPDGEMVRTGMRGQTGQGHWWAHKQDPHYISEICTFTRKGGIFSQMNGIEMHLSNGAKKIQGKIYMRGKECHKFSKNEFVHGVVVWTLTAGGHCVGLEMRTSRGRHLKWGQIGGQHMHGHRIGATGILYGIEGHDTHGGNGLIFRLGFWIKAVLSEITLENIKFDLQNAAHTRSPTMVGLARMSNDSGSPQRQILHINEKRKYTSTITKGWSVKAGIKLTYKTGLPVLAEKSIELSVSTEHSSTTSETVEKEKEFKVTQELVVRPRHRITGRIVVDISRNIRVPYTADAIVKYSGGVTKKIRISSFYEGTDGLQTDVHIEERPLPACELCDVLNSIE